MVHFFVYLYFAFLFFVCNVASQDDEHASLTLSDMKLTDDQITTTRLRNAYIRTNKWPNGIVPYTFHPTIEKDTARKSQIEKAIQIYKTSTCIKWIPRTNEQYYIQFMDGGSGSCYSYVGMTKSVPQPISIGKGCETQLGIIVHEMMHAMGFMHEHMRPDRDQYIKVETSKIEADNLSQFTKVSASDANLQSLGYDFTSVMHYPSTAFSKDGSRTIVTIDPKYQSQIGQRKGFSKCDLEKLNKYYGCTNLLKNDPICVMSVKPVINNSTSTNSTIVPSDCKDDSSTLCQTSSKSCLSYPGYYLKTCKKTCSNCSGNKCFDTDITFFQTMCKSVQRNKCTDQMEKMLCPKSCGLC